MTRIVRWNPFREMMDLRSEFDRLFEESLSGPRSRWQLTNWGMDVDVAENEDNFVVKASLPGMKPEDIDISLTNNVLTIKGEMKQDETIDEDQYHVRERRYGSFSRTVTLPVQVNSEAVEAKYEDGVLTLEVPKAEEVKPKRISVKSESNGRKVIKGS